jgi:UDP-sulfoquinovose synthase
MWDLRITDLMQGPVYGIETEESKIRDERKEVRGERKEERNDSNLSSLTSNLSSLTSEISTIFNYDEIFGTIINRFITQAVVGYPLTVYGKGGQTRGYLNINDTLQCVHMSEQTPAQKGELRIFNQIMETFSANELAEMTRRVGAKLGYNVEINHLENPRKEAEEHYYNPTYQGLINIGVTPHYLTDEVMEEMFKVVEKYKSNIRKDVIFKGIRW